MPGFYYFTPKLGGTSQFAEAGLSYAFDGAPAVTEVGSAIGPQGQPGMVYHAANQPTGFPSPLKWVRIAARWWIGVHEAGLPGPEDLERAGYTITAGGMVEMGDRHNWMIPLVDPCTAIDPYRAPGIPSVYRMVNGDEFADRESVPRFLAPGRPVRMALDPEFDALLAQLPTFRRFIEVDDEPSPATADICNFVIGLLSVGYRVRLPECEVLGLITSQTATQAVMVALDWQERHLAGMGEEYREIHSEIVQGAAAE